MINGSKPPITADEGDRQNRNILPTVGEDGDERDIWGDRQPPNVGSGNRHQNHFDRRQFDYDEEEENRRKTQLNLDYKYVDRALDRVTHSWAIYTDIDSKYWWHTDINQRNLDPKSQKSSQDVMFILQSICNFIIDFVLFHNIVDFMIKLGVPNCPEWIVFLMSCFFPIAYFFGEVAANSWICKAKAQMDAEDGDIGAKIRFGLVCGLGLLLALFPSGAFAYVMNVSETGQSLIFTAIMAILGIVIHLMVVFGGQHIIDARVRIWAKFGNSRLTKARRRAYRKLGKFARRVESYRLKQSMGAKFSSEVETILEFVNESYHSLHPMNRPPKYRFGAYSLYGKDDRHSANNDR